MFCRQAPANFPDIFTYPPQICTTAHTRALVGIVRETTWDRYLATHGGVGLQHYNPYNLEETRDYLRTGLAFPQDVQGINWLLKARLGALWTASKLCRIGYMNLQWANQCPCCLQQGVPETLSHLIVSCPRWNMHRERYLRALLLGLGINSTEEQRCKALLGGRVAVGVQNDGNVGENEQNDPRELEIENWGLYPEGHVAHAPQPPVAVPPDNRELPIGNDPEAPRRVQADDGMMLVPPFVCISHYLEAVMRARRVILAPLLEVAPRADA
jgi:hypothetical protein